MRLERQIHGGMATRSLRRWYAIHKWTSLVCTVFILLLCVTGLPLIFYHEIDHALGNAVDPPERPGVTTRVSLDSLVAEARRLHRDDAVQYVAEDPDDGNAWSVALGKTANARELTQYLTFDVRTGELLNRYPLDEGVMHILYHLHTDLFLDLPGKLFLGGMGLLLVVALVSGVVVYGPFMRKLRFGTVRYERTSRTRWLDLHNLLGIATALWLLVVGVTGVLNTLADPIYNRWKASALGAMTAAYKDAPLLARHGSVEQAVAAAREATGLRKVRFMAFPGNDFATPHHFVAFMLGDTPITSRLMTPVLIDGKTSKVIDQRPLTGITKALLLSQPLHFGDYGGAPLKILWALFDAIAIVVLSSGLYLWWKKRNLSVEQRLALATPTEEP
jgi:uncharacterized iron-regulated membrane protein